MLAGRSLTGPLSFFMLHVISMYVIYVTMESVMRQPVKEIYNRQVARCLSDIDEVYKLPSVVVERIKRAIEYTAKDIDRLNRKESGYGITRNASYQA